jgi:hypothetical protein
LIGRGLTIDEATAMTGSLYRGEVLAGVELPEDVEQFVTLHRRVLNDQAQVIAERLSKALR